MKSIFLILMLLVLSCGNPNKEEAEYFHEIDHMHNLHKVAMVYLSASRLWLIKAENYSSIANVFFDETDSKGQIFLRYTIEALDSAKHYFELHKEYMLRYEADSAKLIAKKRFLSVTALQSILIFSLSQYLSQLNNCN